MKSFLFEQSKNTTKSLGGNCSAGTINSTGNADVAVEVVIPKTATLTDLKPTITFSDHAQVSPANEIEQDFARDTAKRYVVTAQDGTERNYDITIVSRRGVDIISFKIKQSDHTPPPSNVRMTGAEISGTVSSSESVNAVTISLDGQDDTSVNLKPEIIVSPGAAVNPASKAETAFTYGTAQTYTVTAEDTNFLKTYEVTLKSSSKLKSFKFKAEGNNISKGIIKDINGIIKGTSITVDIPYNTQLNGLTPDIELYKEATITTPSGGATTAQDFSSQKTYTITAQDGSTSIYTVTLNRETEPTISEFKFLNSNNGGKNLVNDITGEIKGSDIIVKVPRDADLKGLIPTVRASSTLADTNVYKGATGTEAATTSTDFSNSHTSPIQYSAVGPTGGTKVYNVRVYKEPTIRSFKFTNTDNTGASFPASITEYTASPITQNGISANGTIAITVANTVNVTNLKATISGDNFTATNPVSITFTSTSDTSPYSATIEVAHNDLPDFKKQYTITLTKEVEPTISEFKFTTTSNVGKNLGNDITGEIKGSDIVLKVPYDANISALTPTVTPSSGATAHKGTGTDDANSTATSFEGSHTTPVQYSVVGLAGGRKVYNVKVYKAPAIASFKFTSSANGSAGLPTSPTEYTASSINHGSLSANGTIAITVANTVDVTALLKATITGKNISTSITAIDIAFDSSTSGSTYSKTIKVVNKDLTSFEKEYTVNVTKESAPQLTGFTITADTSKGISSNVIGEITQPGSGSNTGTILLKFPKDNDTAIDLNDLTYTIAPIDGHTLAPSAPLAGRSIDGQTFILTKTDTGSKTEYTVQAVKGPYIESFKFGTSNTGISSDISATNINHNTGKITITVPNGVTLSNLTPTITVGENTKSTPSAQTDFSQSATTPVEYIVTSSNSSATDFTKTYNVTVTKEAAPQLTEFKIQANDSKGIKDEVTATLTHPASDSDGRGGR
ncbi:DUF5018 domain-containing protein [Ichthyobacterium seriolicida]|uniref:Pkd domain containing protein n=1 Tax=Ichthyobacterium seriolicida TaxID=242600 RepID=A0A1J1DXY0_9FLAO|nr:hypothetical protein [Ichthyobacterium seriolicida]BAV94705.1 pkd domain containing protein [Ichthyobacterium seriolicida]